MKHRIIVLPWALLLASAFYFYKNPEQEKDDRVNDPNYYKEMSPLLFKNQHHYNERLTCGTMIKFLPEAHGSPNMIFHNLETLKIILPERIQPKFLRERQDPLQLDSSFSDSLIIEKSKSGSYSPDNLPAIQEI